MLHVLLDFCSKHKLFRNSSRIALSKTRFSFTLNSAWRFTFYPQTASFVFFFFLFQKTTEFSFLSSLFCVGEQRNLFSNRPGGLKSFVSFIFFFFFSNAKHPFVWNPRRCILMFPVLLSFKGGLNKLKAKSAAWKMKRRRDNKLWEGGRGEKSNVPDIIRFDFFLFYLSTSDNVETWLSKNAKRVQTRMQMFRERVAYDRCVPFNVLSFAVGFSLQLSFSLRPRENENTLISAERENVLSPLVLGRCICPEFISEQILLIRFLFPLSRFLLRFHSSYVSTSTRLWRFYIADILIEAKRRKAKGTANAFCKEAVRWTRIS